MSEKLIEEYKDMFFGNIAPYSKDNGDGTFTLFFKCKDCQEDVVFEERFDPIHEYAHSCCNFKNYSFGEDVYNDLVRFL